MGTSVLDRATFERLVLEHLPAAHRFAIRLTGDADAGEEVMQEALLKASRAWQTFAGRSTFRTWLLQIVINAFRDHRSAKVAAGRNGTAGPLPDDVPDLKASDPAGRMSGAEQGERIARLVSALPPRQREVFVLHAYEGLAPAQIAAVLGIEESNTRANLHFARQRLKAWLAPEPEARRPQREMNEEKRT
jgi:RNA polymerase sigma-70 factor (ECF subfamily)